LFRRHVVPSKLALQTRSRVGELHHSCNKLSLSVKGSRAQQDGHAVRLPMAVVYKTQQSGVLPSAT
jgi:hypothetical protein